MKTIPLFVRGFLLLCGRRYVLAGQLMLLLLVAMSSIACAAAVHLPRSHCDVSLEERGHPSCLAESEPLRSSPEAAKQTRNSQDGRYLGQTADGGGRSDVDVTGGPEGYDVKGKPGKLPWQLFMGSAAHKIIGKHYQLRHLDTKVFVNYVSIKAIVAWAGGNEALVRADEALTCPDITDMYKRWVFQIKSSTDGELEKGKVKVVEDITAINRAMAANMQFTHGAEFSGEVHVRFLPNLPAWHLTWSTTAPGVIQYRWNKLNPKTWTEDDIIDAYKRGQWIDLTQAEMEQLAEQLDKFADGWVGRADAIGQVQAATDVVVTVIGDSAVIFLSPGLGVPAKVQPGVTPSVRPSSPPVQLPLGKPGPLRPPPPSMRPPVRPPSRPAAPPPP